METTYKILEEISKEIKMEGENEDRILKVATAYDTILDFSSKARKEGLLALEEMAQALDAQDEAQRIFCSLIMIIIDGTEPGLVWEIGINRLIVSGLNSYDGLRAFLYFRGSLLIQKGEAPGVVKGILKSLVPTSVGNAIEIRESERKALEATEEKNIIERLCEDNKSIDKKDHSLINQTAMTLLEMSDRGIQRLLRNVDNTDVSLVLKGMPGKARKRIFDNVSKRLGVLLAEDMEYMGPVRRCQVEEACCIIMNQIVLLTDQGEIPEIDTSILKVVLDIYHRAEEKNRQLRQEYKEIKSIIDKIYGN